jgi:hypothetical protein
MATCFGFLFIFILLASFSSGTIAFLWSIAAIAFPAKFFITGSLVKRTAPDLIYSFRAFAIVYAIAFLALICILMSLRGQVNVQQWVSGSRTCDMAGVPVSYRKLILTDIVQGCCDFIVIVTSAVPMLYFIFKQTNPELFSRIMVSALLFYEALAVFRPMFVNTLISLNMVSADASEEARRLAGVLTNTIELSRLRRANKRD